MAHTARITELIPTDGHKSFCHKAKVIDTGNMVYLMSYDTIMCGIDRRGKLHRYSDYDGKTTRRHLKSFLNARDYERFFDIGVEERKATTF